MLIEKHRAGLRIIANALNYFLGCPSPECDYISLVKRKHNASIHFLNSSSGLRMAMPRKYCEYDDYLNPRMLERHRMRCHIGSPLQRGQHDCSQILVAERRTSRGQTIYTSPKTYRFLKPNPQSQTQIYTILVKFASLRSPFVRTHALLRRYYLRGQRKLQVLQKKAKVSCVLSSSSSPDKHYSCLSLIPMQCLS